MLTIGVVTWCWLVLAGYLYQQQPHDAAMASHLWAESPGVHCRYVMPLLVAATFAGSMKYVLSMRQWSAWVTPASGVLLLAGGTYSLLSRAFPA